VIAAAALSPGCGGAGQALTASEFVDRINAEGVSIELERKLPSGENAKEIYAVTLPPLRGEPRPAPGAEGGAGGSLYVFDDTSRAEDQIAACHRSGGLICFRAANVVVVLDNAGSGLEAQRLAVAIRRLARR
jgi:hypothetical protein